MNVVILFFFGGLTTLVSSACTKLCSNNIVGNSKAKYTLYLAFNSIVACLFFWISGGFHLALNWATFLYCLVNAGTVALILVALLMAYKLATISGVNIIQSVPSLLGSLVFGALLFHEAVGISDVLRVLIMIVAVFFVFLDQKRKEAVMEHLQELTPKNTVKKVLVLGALLIGGLVATAINKGVAVSEKITDITSFCFFSNLMIATVALLVFLVEALRHREDAKDAIRLLRPKQLIPLATNTVCSNIGSLIAFMIMARLDVSIYTPISHAVGIFSCLVSSWIFREKLGIYAYLAAALSCVAVLL